MRGKGREDSAPRPAPLSLWRFRCGDDLREPFARADIAGANSRFADPERVRRIEAKEDGMPVLGSRAGCAAVRAAMREAARGRGEGAGRVRSLRCGAIDTHGRA